VAIHSKSPSRQRHVRLIGITVDPQLGDIEIQQGVFSTEAAMTTLGRSPAM